MCKLLTFFVRIRLDLRFLCASWHSLILNYLSEAVFREEANLSVKALLVLFQWTDMSEAALLIKLFTSYLSCRVADLPAACKDGLHDSDHLNYENSP